MSLSTKCPNLTVLVRVWLVHFAETSAISRYVRIPTCPVCLIMHCLSGRPSVHALWQVVILYGLECVSRLISRPRHYHNNFIYINLLNTIIIQHYSLFLGKMSLWCGAVKGLRFVIDKAGAGDCIAKSRCFVKATAFQEELKVALDIVVQVKRISQIVSSDGNDFTRVFRVSEELGQVRDIVVV